MSLAVLRTVAALPETTRAGRGAGLRVAVAPTIGAPHDGHLSPVRAAVARVDRAIVTLSVNPRRLASAAELAAYPRTEEADAAKLAPLGAHLLFAPDAAEMHPPGSATTVSVRGVSGGLYGAHRSGRLEAVAAVVTTPLPQTRAMSRPSARKASSSHRW